jgi:hypothetical protein
MADRGVMPLGADSFTTCFQAEHICCGRQAPNRDCRQRYSQGWLQDAIRRDSVRQEVRAKLWRVLGVGSADYVALRDRSMPPGESMLRLEVGALIKKCGFFGYHRRD